MAVDRAIDSTEFDSKLTTVADAIRTAGGTTEPMSFPSGMVEAISSISSGGGGTEELSALLKILGCSEYEISVVQQIEVYGNPRIYVPITSENLKSSLRLIFIPGTNSLFPTNTIKKAPILRAVPSMQPAYGFFAYMPPFVLLENDKNTIVALQHNGVVNSYSYKTSNSFTQDGGGFVFENNTLIINLYYLCNIIEADLDSMLGKKVLLMGGNVQ